MKISAYEKIKLATHIERKVTDMNIANEEIEAQVYADIEKQLKREFGLNRKHPDLKAKHIYDAHEFVDCYEVPMYLKEMIEDANAQMSLGR